MFTNEELQALLNLLGKVHITGLEAPTCTHLIQKCQRLLTQPVETPSETEQTDRQDKS